MNHFTVKPKKVRTCNPLVSGNLNARPRTAQHYAEIRVDLKRRGAQIGAADLMIAAHARAMGAIVVTNNVKDFGRVKGLQVENWTK